VRDDFEAEVRAMLARRAADLTPTAAGPPREADLRAAAPPASHPWTAPSRRRLMAAAAALLLAGVATYAVARDTSPPVHTSVGTPPGPAPIIWPLNPVTPTGPLAEPGDAAAAYLAESVDIDGRESAQQPTLWPPVVEGDEATVHYSIGDLAGDVALRRDGDRWGVTSASSDAVRIDAAEPEQGRVDVVIELGPAVAAGTAVRVLSIDAAGTMVTEDLTGFVVAETEDGLELVPPSGEPIRPAEPGGRTFTVEAPLGLPQPPAAAVRVDLLRLDDDPLAPRVVIAHAAIPVATPDDGSGATDRADLGDAGSPEAPVVDAPGVGTTSSVVPATTVLWASGERGTAADAALAYLDARMPERATQLRLVPGAGEQDATGGGTTVEIPWEIADGSDISGRYSGVIRLRDDPGGWAVVTATTDQIGVSVRPDGRTVGVTITWLDPEAIDGVEITLLDAAGRAVSDDEFVLWPTPGETLVPVADGVDPTEVRTVRLRHAGGTWFSLTEVPVA
jgi:hypothetical protein